MFDLIWLIDLQLRMCTNTNTHSKMSKCSRLMRKTARLEGPSTLGHETHCTERRVMEVLQSMKREKKEIHFAQAIKLETVGRKMAMKDHSMHKYRNPIMSTHSVNKGWRRSNNVLKGPWDTVPSNRRMASLNEPIDSRIDRRKKKIIIRQVQAELQGFTMRFKRFLSRVVH